MVGPSDDRAWLASAIAADIERGSNLTRRDHGAVKARAADYAWIDDWQQGLIGMGYCMTLVQGLTPVEVLNRLGARRRAELVGISQMVESAFSAWEGVGIEELLVSVTDAGGGWALMFEPNGFVGATPGLMAPVSAGTTTVGHYLGANGADQFLWLRDRQVLLQFEPLFPETRHGTRATDIVPEMRAAGFDIDGTADDEGTAQTMAAFALGERITDVRVRPETLEGSTFLAGHVALGY